MNSEPDSRDPVARAAALVRLFCGLADFGECRSVMPDQVPEPAKTLLDHRSHMTVAMERFHGCDVRLRVVAQADDGREHGPNDGWYAREILLETPAGKIALTHVRVIDGTGAPAQDDRTLLIDNDTITAINDGAVEVPDGYTIIDASGKSAIPGIVGMHDHQYYIAWSTK